MRKLILFLPIFLLGLLSANAQVVTWINPESNSTNHSVVINQGQVMEVLSIALDNSSSVQLISGTEEMTLGSPGNPNIPYPLVIAGPSTVIFKKTSTGGQGSMMTFRIVDTATTVTQVPLPKFVLQK